MLCSWAFSTARRGGSPHSRRLKYKCADELIVELDLHVATLDFEQT